MTLARTGIVQGGVAGELPAARRSALLIVRVPRIDLAAGTNLPPTFVRYQSMGLWVRAEADRNGLERELTEWVSSRQDRLLRAAFLLTGDDYRAEDLLQEALIKVALRWPQLRDESDATDRAVAIRAALMTLTPKQRAVLVLRYFEDLSENDAAEVLSVTVGTVKSQTAAALSRLRHSSPYLGEFLLSGASDG